MSDVELTNEWDVLAIRWVWWCWTRRLFAPRVKSNVLARLQVNRSLSTEPDSFLDAQMPAFNMAVHSLCDMPEHELEAVSFLAVHWYAVNIKAIAREQGCARATVYNRARRFAQRASQLSKSIHKTQQMMAPDMCQSEAGQNSAVVD